MSFFEKVDTSIFRPMVSKHNAFYVEMLLEIDMFMDKLGAISIEKEEFKEHLNDYIIARGEEHVLDEEEDGIHREFLNDKSTGAYVLNIFERYKWLSIDHRSFDYKEMISIPYTVRLFINFMKECVNDETQAYFMIAIDTQLDRLLAKEDITFSYMLFNNIHRAMGDLIMMLQKTTAKVRDYYEHGLQEIDPKSLMNDYFISYYEEIIEKFVFPTVVDDSIKRFKGPVREKMRCLYNDSYLLEKIQESASVYNKRKKDMSIHQIEDICLQIIMHLDNVDALTDELIKQNEKYRNRFKQILLFQLNVDSNVLYDVNVVLQNLNSHDDVICDFVNKEMNYHCIEYIDEDTLADLQRKERKTYEQSYAVVDMDSHFDEIDHDFEQQQEQIQKFSDFYLIHHFNHYVERCSVKSIRDIPIDSDDDYIRAILLSIQEDVQSFPYTISTTQGSVIKGKFTLPLFNIERGDT